ncbi:hypothetical protein G5I_10055 [Acromyrmex echinatior]|uniref:Uncharacterized protein n=1 Tax=Acromyrmex echinatior TaxID=103372 RepID=F4WVV2_ACREC|nr:hypothetical protein G5I_10055 [Acromyrmex echinatior]
MRLHVCVDSTGGTKWKKKGSDSVLVNHEKAPSAPEHWLGSPFSTGMRDVIPKMVRARQPTNQPTNYPTIQPTIQPTNQPGITYRDTNRRKWNFLPSRRQAGQPDDGLIDVAGLAVRQPLYTSTAVQRASAHALICTYALVVLGGRRVLIARGDVCC